mgnify:FL=1
MDYSEQLKHMILNYPELLERLEYLRGIHTQAYFSAGVIRNLVWSILHDQRYCIDQTEIDVIFYDADVNHHPIEEQRLTELLSKQFPENTWDVVNQAFVHEWYRLDDGSTISQYCSLLDALSVWVETATAIAVRLTENNELDIVVPFGLDDLFELKLRWNDRLVSHAVFLERVRSKQFLERWGQLQLMD